MIERLSGRGRRALALGLLAAAVLLVAAMAAAPAWLAYAQREELAAVERRIADLRRRLPAREGLIAEERLLGRPDALERALLRGGTPALAAAALQGDLTALASAMGAVVTSVQILDPEAAAPFTDVGLRLTMVCDVSTLRDFLYAVETREPMMLLRSFALGRADGGSVSGDPVPGGAEPLTATVEIHGYLAGVAAGVAAPAGAAGG